MTSARILIQSLIAAACLAALAGCQTAPTSAAPPAVKYMDVNGARLPYVEQGTGPTVVLVHGAVSDYRTWDRHRAALAKDYRAISYTQRYFGTEPWGQNWPAFGVQTHADDLAAFIRGLGVGPVHLVAWSYSGHIVLNVASNNPELVKSVFAFEPAVPSYVTDPAELKALGDDAGATFGASTQAAAANDNAASVRLLIDGVGERSGYFEAQPAAVKAVQLDSARSMPLLHKQPPPPPITCAQMGQIKAPVAIVRGAEVRPFFRIIADAAARCMPAGKHIVVPNAKHMWPGEDAAGFGAAVRSFLAGK